MARTYITVSIPYVNARPHVGYALELVEADVLARQRRATGGDVRFLGGTDDHALEERARRRGRGRAHAGLRRRATRRPSKRCAIRSASPSTTSSAPAATPVTAPASSGCGARRRRTATSTASGTRARTASGASGSTRESELVDGCCPEHRTPAETVAEENWFFRLSRYQQQLVDLIEEGTLEIVPETYRNEVLAFLAGGLDDISVSRSQTRARGWGIPVPDDPSQVIYVWWDALGNYVTALDYGTDGDAFDTWWRTSDERIHVVGKGIVRFHAVYWPAMLLSAGELPPTKIYVHPYLTAEGQKLSKSAGNSVDPVAVVDEVGTDALRWWLLRDVPRTVDADFTIERVVARSDEDLAHGVGNLVHRIATMVHRLADGTPPASPAAVPDGDGGSCRAEIDAALVDFDFRRAVGVVRDLVDATNRRVDETRPWKLERGSAELADALGELVASARLIGELLTPFLPDTAARVVAALTPGVDGRLPDPEPVVQLLEPANH